MKEKARATPAKTSAEIVFLTIALIASIKTGMFATIDSNISTAVKFIPRLGTKNLHDKIVAIKPKNSTSSQIGNSPSRSNFLKELKSRRIN
jgi:hypothetical protein